MLMPHEVPGLPETRQPVIRLATEEDVEPLHRMLKSLAGNHGPEAEFLAEPEDIRRDGFGPQARYESWVVEVAAVPAGFASFFPTYSTFKSRTCLHLDNLYVEPEFRGLGLAQLLLRQVRQRALELECWRIDLHVHVSSPARQVYERFGFTHTSDTVYSLPLQSGT